MVLLYLEKQWQSTESSHITYIKHEWSGSVSADHDDKNSVVSIGCKNPNRSIPISNWCAMYGAQISRMYWGAFYIHCTAVKHWYQKYCYFGASLKTKKKNETSCTIGSSDYIGSIAEYINYIDRWLSLNSQIYMRTNTSPTIEKAWCSNMNEQCYFY